MMDNNRVYISGAITGVDDYESKFEQAEKHLVSKGLSVINPAKFNKCLTGLSYEEYMLIDMTLIDMCGTMYMLEGWERSCGSNREYGYALAKNMIIIKQDMKDYVTDECSTSINDMDITTWHKEEPQSYSCNIQVPKINAREEVSVETILEERKTMTWKEISDKHGIPVSTLCCRAKSYGKRANKKSVKTISNEPVINPSKEGASNPVHTNVDNKAMDVEYDAEEVKDYYMLHNMQETAEHFKITIEQLRRIIMRHKIFKDARVVEEYMKTHNAGDYAGGEEINEW